MKPPSSLPSTRGGSAGVIIVSLFAFCFGLVGIVTAILAASAFLDGEYGQGAFLSVFALTFGGFGIAMGVFVVEGRKKARIALDLRTAHPSEPWYWREEWAAGAVMSGAKNTMVFAWFFSILWNLISLPLLFILLPEILEKGNYPALLGLLFPLVGIGLLIWAIRETVEWRKFGKSVFRMNSVPGVIGGELSGTVNVAASFDPAQVFDASLTCINRRTTGAGKTTSTTETVLWQEKIDPVRPFAQPEAMGSAVPVRFQIPYDCEQTNDTNPNNRILWRLEIHAAVAGIDYDAKFEVPVFRTPASRPAGMEDMEPPPENFQPSAEAGITFDVSPTGGTIIVVRPARARGSLVAMTLFTLLWTGVIVLLVTLGAPVVFIIAFSLFEILFLFALLQLGFGSSRIVIEGDSVTVENSILGIPMKNSLKNGDIESIRPSIGMQSGKTVLYSITLNLRNGKRRALRVALREKHDAEWLAAEIRRRIGAGQTHDMASKESETIPGA